jgi:hypothetical protein
VASCTCRSWLLCPDLTQIPHGFSQDPSYQLRNTTLRNRITGCCHPIIDGLLSLENAARPPVMTVSRQLGREKVLVCLSHRNTMVDVRQATKLDVFRVLTSSLLSSCVVPLMAFQVANEPTTMQSFGATRLSSRHSNYRALDGGCMRGKFPIPATYISVCKMRDACTVDARDAVAVLAPHQACPTSG